MKKPFKPTYLYIKTHNTTGLKYFGKTTKEDPYKYMGSGKYWCRHLKVHGNNVSTEILGYFVDEAECILAATNFSNINMIVESDEWANFRIETGIDGGDPYMGRTWREIAKSEEEYLNRLDKFHKNMEKRRTPEWSKAHSDRVKLQWESSKSDDRRKVLSEKVSGGGNPSAKTYLIIPPIGDEFIVKGLRSFCLKKGFSYSMMRANIDKGKIIRKSKKDTSFFTFENKRKLLNWEIREIKND